MADWCEIVYRQLKAHQVTAVAHVPDIVLAPLIARLEADESFTVTQLSREEEGVGVLAGSFLGGRRGALLLQGSGLGNCVNALASLTIPYQLPLLLIVSPRGELGEWNPSQVPMGRALRPILEALQIQHHTLQPEEDIAVTVDMAASLAFATNTVVALIVSPRLSGGKRE